VSSAVPTVYLVDDEPELRRAVERLLRAEGYAVVAFDAPAPFLEAATSDTRGCVLLDVAMPGLDGLAVQQRLLALGSRLPIVFLTGQGDIPMSVEAMRAGAVDFLTKPVNSRDLLRAIGAALALAASRAAAHDALASLRAREALLTPREREVFAHVIAGKLNKVIAADLGTTEQTVKVHRGRVMEKLGADSVVDLVNAGRALGIAPVP